MKRLIIAFVLLIALQGTRAIEDGGLHENAQLVYNTDYCIPLPSGKYHCEAIFTITATDEKQLVNSQDVLITFEDQEQRSKTVRFTTDFAIGTLQRVNRTVQEWAWVRNDTLQNGSIEPVFALQDKTVAQDEIVYHGKRRVPGTNYVRIFTDDFDETWVDWHVRLTGIPVSVEGTITSVDFDTHEKGWAVWSSGTSIPAGFLTHYSFEEASGNFLDSSPNALHGTPQAGVLRQQTGILSYAAKTAASNANITTPLGSYPTGGNFSFSIWVKVSGNSTSAQNRVWSDSGGIATLFVSDSSYCDAVGKVCFTMWNGAVQKLGPTSNASYADGNWHHIAVVTAGTQHRLYLDGINTNNNTNTINAMGSARVLSWNGSGFMGSIDEYTEYNRALTDADVAALYNNGNPPGPLPRTNFTPRYQRHVLVGWNTSQPNAPSQVSNKSLRITVDASTFNNTAKANFGDVRVKMVNNTNNDTPWDYTLTIINGTHANVTFTVSSTGAGLFNFDQRYFLVWGNDTAVTTSNATLATNFVGAPTNWTFGLLTDYSEGASYLNNTEGEAALEAGIQASAVWPQATVYTNQQVYLHDLSNNQVLATVDRVVAYGNQRWLFNYDTSTTAGLFNITPVVYSLELVNMTGPLIQQTVIDFISATKQ